MVAAVDDNLKEYVGDGNLIRLQDFTSFDWDSMYVFYNWSEEISFEIGFPCKCGEVPDNYQRYVFVRNQEIVHSEEFFSADSRIYFYAVKKTELGRMRFSPENAVFEVKAERRDSPPYEIRYRLLPPKRDYKINMDIFITEF